MKTRDLGLFLGLEVLAIVWAGVLFSVLESKLLAGGLAGSYFVISGLFMLWLASRWSARWASLTWYLLFAQVFLVSLPMLLTRFLHSDIPFTDVRILGLSGPAFHQLSSVVFGALMLATVADLARSVWASRRGPQQIQ